MAIVPKFIVVAAERTVASNQTIAEGQIVSLNTSGQVVAGTNSLVPYGIAGDTQSTSQSYMPGVVAGWQNRVSDYFDETKASAKMTVYHSGGEFATDQISANVSGLTTVSLQPLYCNDAGLLDTTVASTTYPVARLLTVPGNYPSGVPGTDINGDAALGGNNLGVYTGAGVYAEIKLII